MNFLGDKGPNYNGGLVRLRTHRFKWPSPAPSVPVVPVVPVVVVGESIHVSLSVGVRGGETRINTGSKSISASVETKAK